MLDKDSSFKYLFSSLARRHLEYCAWIWYPLLKKDKKQIENVLCCSLKAIAVMAKFLYDERLPATDISSLKYCQLLVNMTWDV